MTDAAANHFIRQIIVNDRAAGKHGGRVATRFPPEPNGYLHLGHAKSICLNFGLAREFGGNCDLRYDDTNPAKEEQEYVDAIQSDVNWLGFEWNHLRHTSDYFEVLYLCAEKLIRDGKAFVCDLSADEVREYRGTLTEPGRNSPFRDRTPGENLDLFRRMRAGEFADGARTLRAKIDMASGNINMRDPTIYRIRKLTHQHTGDAWPIYPMYDYAHCVSDAVEGITHSLCTLEFEDHRPLYDWFLDQLDLMNHAELVEPMRRAGLAGTPSRPQQIEFARGNLDYTVMSKRKLMALVTENLVDGWDDPRMPTLAGVRRRGFPPAAIRAFWERAGVTKQNSVIEFSVLENSVREVLDASAPRRMAVLDPLKLVITNLDVNHDETIEFANHPKNADFGARHVPFSRELWIERDDFAEVPPKGFHRLVPDGEVRLRNVGIVRCVEVVKNADGSVREVHATLDPETRHGMPGADRKVKGTIHWVSSKHAIDAEVRLYDRLFSVADPDDTSDGKTYAEHLNRDAKRVVRGFLEPLLADAEPEANVQFERLGYFVADRYDHSRAKPVFNRTVTLRDSYATK
ncbi:MAG TPA: glutamine--tRNA ligase/YqeY domain fusion protein [Rhodanobacteraceae bacterium]|nr:glutamine--tRNA ligase/YqeY domain fusion protein [Rhodanobacteraceae bacterium]